MATATKTGVVQAREVGPPDIARLEALTAEYALSALASKGRFERALVLAEGIGRLREALAPAMPKFMALMNSPLGFLTDKDPRKPRKDGDTSTYPLDVVRDCLIEALLRGLYPVGNEFNIIRAKEYTTKEGFAGLLKREVPGLANLRKEPGVPKVMQGGAIVPFRLSWRYQGVKDERDANVVVRLDGGMGADAAIGKAERRMLKWLYEYLTGSEILEPDDDGEHVLPADALPAPASNGAPLLGRPDPATREQLAQIRQLSARLDSAECEAKLADYGVGDPAGLSRNQAVELLAWLQEGANGAGQASEGVEE